MERLHRETWHFLHLMFLVGSHLFFIHTILSLILLTPASLAQFMDSVKPDISFNDNNDRFDLTSMMRAHNKMYRDTPLVDDDEGEVSEADFRRHLQPDDAEAVLEILQHDLPKTRKDGEIDFAYDPDNLPQIGRAGNGAMLDLEYQENLKAFADSIPKPASRRNVPSDQHENEVLMQNVVPIVMTVDGFLKAPLIDKISDKGKYAAKYES